MQRFLLGFIAAVVIVLLGEFLWVRLGFVDSRADVPESVLERKVAMPSLDASLDRHAGEARNPIAAADASLLAGDRTDIRPTVPPVMVIPVNPMGLWRIPSIRVRPNSWKMQPTCRRTRISTSFSMEYVSAECPGGRVL